MTKRNPIHLALLLAALVVCIGLPQVAAEGATDTPGVEWLVGDAAHAQVTASRGVVLVDLYADF